MPIPAIAGGQNPDNSLFNNPRGGLHIELWNSNTDTGFVDVRKAQEPYLDILSTGGDTLEFYRLMDEIDSTLIAGGLQQGNEIYIRAALSDRAGNKTHGDTSATIFLVDPFPPRVSEINDGNVLTVDTLYSEDFLSAYWTGSSDTTVGGVAGSGISYYDYTVSYTHLTLPTTPYV